MTRLEQLLIDFADLGLTHGYIGNLERWGDDRRWALFTKLSSRPAAPACDVSLWLDGSDVDEARAREWLLRQRERLAAGELHRVCGQRWLGRALEDAARGAVPAYWRYQ